LFSSGHPEAGHRPPDAFLNALLQHLALACEPLGHLGYLSTHLVLAPSGHGLKPLHHLRRLLLDRGNGDERLCPHALDDVGKGPFFLNFTTHSKTPLA